MDNNINNNANAEQLDVDQILANADLQNRNFTNLAFRRMRYNVIVNFIIGSALLALALSKSGTEGRHQAKACLIISAGLKILFVIPFNAIIYWLCKRGTLNITLFQAYTSLLIFLYLPWSIYCSVVFFNNDGDLKKNAVPLYIGMWYLLFEAILYMLATFCLVLLLVLVCVIVRSQMRQNQAQAEENRRISNLVRGLDVLQIAGDQIPTGEDCIICMDPLEGNSTEVIRLPCNSRHMFHLNCVSKWIEGT